LEEVSSELEKLGLSASKQYLSRLQNGKNPPASEELNRALAKVTGGDADQLIWDGYIEKAPEEIKPILEQASTLNEIFAFFGLLIMFIEEYRTENTINQELIEKIEKFDLLFANVYKFKLTPEKIRYYPEYAVALIARLKNHFLPFTDSISFKGVTLNLNDYVTQDGQPIFKENPYPNITSDTEKYALYQMVEEKDTLINEMHDSHYELNKKMKFFEKLEQELGLDLTDPEVQKKLKTAAKIIFSQED
jgi:transcriptional regulator with XRE-family HTH domain